MIRNPTERVTERLRISIHKGDRRTTSEKGKAP